MRCHGDNAEMHAHGFNHRPPGQFLVVEKQEVFAQQQTQILSFFLSLFLSLNMLTSSFHLADIIEFNICYALLYSLFGLLHPTPQLAISQKAIPTPDKR